MCFLASGIFAGRKADAPEKSVVLLALLQRPMATEEITSAPDSKEEG